MELTKILLENGQEITSGQQGNGVASMSLTRAVNSGQDLTVGSVCAAMAEIELLTDGTCPIQEGSVFSLYQGKEKVGVFTAQKPRIVSTHRVKITAYDNVAKLDQDLTEQLETILSQNVTLRDLAETVCRECGADLSADAFPNEDLPVKPFTGKGITGRRILSWIAQAAGRFCTADPEGLVQFGWYQPNLSKTIGPNQSNRITPRLEGDRLILEGLEGHLQGEDLCLLATVEYEDGNITFLDNEQCFYYQGSLQLEDYQVMPIARVQIRQNSEDVGTIYPDIPQGETYVIEGNPLLTAENPQEVLAVAQMLYHQLKEITYTPCTVTLPADAGVAVGDILPLTTKNGTTVTVYLMESCKSGQRIKFHCYGEPSRDPVHRTNQYTLEALSGKVLQLQTDVEGLQVKHQDAAGNVASLTLTLNGMESQVSAQTMEMNGVKESLSMLQQDSSSLQLQLQTITQSGVDKVVTSTGYSFSEDGLRISRSGLEMENLLDHTGMQVVRNGQVILQADNRGVKARDVQVENYLIIGSHARFEDYADGTACFYI